MTKDDIRKTILDVIATTFDADPASLSDTTVASDVDGWDSLGHTVLMIRLGKQIGTPVPESIASQARSVGELVQLMAARLGAR